MKQILKRWQLATSLLLLSIFIVTSIFPQGAFAGVEQGTVVFVTNHGNQTVKFNSLSEAINHTDDDGNKANETDSGGGFSKAYFIGWSTVPNYDGSQRDAKIFYGHEPLSNAFPDGFDSSPKKLYAFYLDSAVVFSLAGKFHGNIEINRESLIPSSDVIDNIDASDIKSVMDKTTTVYLKNNVSDKHKLNFGASFTLNPFITAVVRYSPSHYFQPGTAEHYPETDAKIDSNPNNYKEKIADVPDKYTYVDLHVKLDPRIEVANTLEFNFNSYSFRPFAVLKPDYSGKFATQTINGKHVSVDTEGQKEFIVRTRILGSEVPPTVSLAEATKDMELISTKADNFQIAKEDILKIARDEEAPLEIGGHIQGGMKLYQRSFFGFVMGGPTDIPRQVAKNVVIDFEPVKVKFNLNTTQFGETTEQNLGTTIVAKEGNVDDDILNRSTKPTIHATGEAMPDALPNLVITSGTKAGEYLFKGWNTKPDGTGDSFTGKTIVSKDIAVYAVWERKRTPGSSSPGSSEEEETPPAKPPEKEQKPDIVTVNLNRVDHYSYMVGYPDRTFKADAQMTRAEVTMMFARLLKDRPVGTPFMANRYSDVIESNWFSYAVDYMSEQNIVKGYPDGTFRPNAPITRAEFAAISAKFDNLLDEGNSTFGDVSENHWATKFIAKAAKKGWVSGYPDGTFKPNQNITRVEVVSSTNRILNRYADVEFAKLHKGELAPMIDIVETHWGYGAIVEAMNGHDYVRLEDGKTEKWEEINGKAFTFPTPLAK